MNSEDRAYFTVAVFLLCHIMISL